MKTEEITKDEQEVTTGEATLEQKIEAVLFVAGEGLTAAYMAEKLGVRESAVNAAIAKLQKKYNDHSGIQLIKYRNNFQFATNPETASAVSAVLNPVRERNLTRAALETLAIVAYKQPITKPEIDDIRGVASDYPVHVLLDNNLIEIVGKKDALGRPLLYGTTDNFLKRFELTDIKHLPSHDELLAKLQTLSAHDFDLYNSNRVG
jgi:segregation and condensation protein B